MLGYNEVPVTCPPFRKLSEEESKAVCVRTGIDGWKRNNPAFIIC